MRGTAYVAGVGVMERCIEIGMGGGGVDMGREGCVDNWPEVV